MRVKTQAAFAPCRFRPGGNLGRSPGSADPAHICTWPWPQHQLPCAGTGADSPDVRMRRPDGHAVAPQRPSDLLPAAAGGTCVPVPEIPGRAAGLPSPSGVRRPAVSRGLCGLALEPPVAPSLLPGPWHPPSWASPVLALQPSCLTSQPGPARVQLLVDSQCESQHLSQQSPGPGGAGGPPSRRRA